MAYKDIAATNTSSSNPSVNMPATAAAGDRALCFVIQDTNGTTIASPAGWTSTELTNANQSGPDGQTFRCFEKKQLDGTEGASQVWTAPNNNARWLIVVFSGRHATNDVSFATPTTNTTSDGTSPRTITAASGTCVAGDDVIAVFNTDQQGGSDVWSFSGWSSGLTEQNEGNTTWISVGAATVDSASAGAFGSVSVDITRTTGSNNTGWGAIVVAIPSSGGGGGGGATIMGQACL